jgi:membrane protease YdiL (CAAX protease family)
MTMDVCSISLLADVQQWNLTALWLLSALSVFVWIGLISIVVWIALIKRDRNPLMPQRRHEAPWGLVDLWGIMLFWFLAVTMTGLVAANWSENKSMALAASGAASLLATAAGLVLLFWRYRDRAAEFFRPQCWWREIGFGLIGFVAVTPPIFWLMAVLVQFFPYHHDTLDQLQKDPGWINVLASYFAAGVAAPIGEEFFFRGVLLPWLARLKLGATRAHRIACVYGDSPQTLSDFSSVEVSAGNSNPTSRLFAMAWPIVASAAAFALLHLGQGPAPYALLVFGIALGYIYLRTRSLLACIVLHAMLNIYSLTWETLAAWEGASGN